MILFVISIVLLLTLFTLFTEPGVGKARVKRLKEDLRCCRSCRHIYSLLVGMAAITQPLSLLIQQL